MCISKHTRAGNAVMIGSRMFWNLDVLQMEMMRTPIDLALTETNDFKLK